MLLLPAPIDTKLKSCAHRTARDIARSFDHMTIADVRKIESFQSETPTQKIRVRVNFFKNGKFASVTARKSSAKTNPGTDEFDSSVAIFAHFSCGDILLQDLVKFLIAREARIRHDRGLRELVELSDHDLETLAATRTGARWSSGRIFNGAEIEMALFKEVARIEIEARQSESNHQRLFAASTGREEREAARAQIGAERAATAKWYDRNKERLLAMSYSDFPGYCEEDQTVLLRREEQVSLR